MPIVNDDTPTQKQQTCTHPPLAAEEATEAEADAEAAAAVEAAAFLDRFLGGIKTSPTAQCVRQGNNGVGIPTIN